MAAKKIFFFLIPLFIVSLLVILSSSLFSLPLLLQKPIASAGTMRGCLYQDDFSHWRDETTNPGFNAWLQSRAASLFFETKEASFGKVMSDLTPIRVKITKATQIILRVKQISPGCVGTVRIMNAYEPYDVYQVASIRKRGEYLAPLQKISGWEGDTNLWIEIWLEGKGKSMTIDSVAIVDPTQPSIVARRLVRSQKQIKKAPVPKYVLFQDDLDQGYEGWRNDETNPGFNTFFDLERNPPRLKLTPASRGGKWMSPEAGLRIEITPETEFVISLGDLGHTRLKVELMEAQAPYQTRQLCNWISAPGIYSAKIAEKTKWHGSKLFWIQIWQEATTNDDHAMGAVIKSLCIQDKSLQNTTNQTQTSQKN